MAQRLSDSEATFEAPARSKRQIVASDPDRELVRAAQNGDKMAMERLYRLHCAAVHAYALRCTGNQDRADEVTQETFIRAFRSLHRFAGRSTFRTWLFAIAINRTRTQLKRTGTETALADMDVAALPDTSTSADIWTRDQLQKALALLALHKAQAHEWNEFRVSDVARATSAAPTYFEVARVLSKTEVNYPLIDGGVFVNNPTLCAYAEAHQVFCRPNDQNKHLSRR